MSKEWEQERAELEGKLADAEARTRRSDGALNELAHAVSHDLRAPLRAISTFSSWLERDLEGKLTGETAEYMRLLRSRTEHLEKLIEGMLAFSRADAKPAAVVPTDCTTLVQSIAPRAQCANLPVFETERESLQSLLMILLDNAHRFASDESAIRVTARELASQYEFSVSDDGPGVPARLQDRIWLLFQSAQPPDAEGSTGVGLAIARKIVERRGGSIWIDPEVTHGATFRFTWPMETAA